MIWCTYTSREAALADHWCLSLSASFVSKHHETVDKRNGQPYCSICIGCKLEGLHNSIGTLTFNKQSAYADSEVRKLVTAQQRNHSKLFCTSQSFNDNHTSSWLEGCSFLSLLSSWSLGGTQPSIFMSPSPRSTRSGNKAVMCHMLHQFVNSVAWVRQLIWLHYSHNVVIHSPNIGSAAQLLLSFVLSAA